jgi:hypothetical protein
LHIAVRLGNRGAQPLDAALPGDPLEMGQHGAAQPAAAVFPDATATCTARWSAGV